MTSLDSPETGDSKLEDLKPKLGKVPVQDAQAIILELQRTAEEAMTEFDRKNFGPQTERK